MPISASISHHETLISLSSPSYGYGLMELCQLIPGLLLNYVFSSPSPLQGNLCTQEELQLLLKQVYPPMSSKLLDSGQPTPSHAMSTKTPSYSKLFLRAAHLYISNLAFLLLPTIQTLPALPSSDLVF